MSIAYSLHDGKADFTPKSLKYLKQSGELDVGMTVLDAGYITFGSFLCLFPEAIEQNHQIAFVHTAENAVNITGTKVTN